ncbi:hypothetical protein CVIRNUC_003100 [Coccomyxa viridis]|uniref:Uncharacterized protein n=1 Tax=Coccomyxa viridis TaxID=1274662 RepID=A0AAV1I0P3_9CHLO|nr:hypothetical protein CVIRNUC_003100 [Coccomyxa viridis]
MADDPSENAPAPSAQHSPTRAPSPGPAHLNLPKAPAPGPAHLNLPKAPAPGPAHLNLPRAPAPGPAHLHLPKAPAPGPALLHLPRAPAPGPAHLKMPKAQPAAASSQAPEAPSRQAHSRAKTPAPAMGRPVLQNDDMENKDGPRAVVVPSADDYGINFIVNINNNPGMPSAQASYKLYHKVAA